MIRKSLALRVLAISFILLALPLLINSFIQFKTNYEQSLKDAKQRLVSISLERVPSISELTAAKVQLLSELELIFNFPEQLNKLPNTSLNKSFKLLADAGGFNEMLFLKKDAHGNYIAVASSDESSIGENYSTAIDFKQLAQRGYFIYPTYEDVTLDKSFYIGINVRDKEEKTLGIFLISISLSDKLQRRLRPVVGKYPINFALLTEDMVVFAATDPTLELQMFLPLSAKQKEDIVTNQQFGNLSLPKEPLTTSNRQGYPFIEFVWNDATQLAYLERIFDAQMYLITYAEKESIFGEKFFNLLQSYALYALTLILGGAITFWLTLRMAKPLRNLSGVMSSVRKGDLQSRYKEDALGFEINALGEIFNEMIDSLLQQMKKAESERVQKELFSKELRIGQEVQRSLLPQTTLEYPNVDIAEVYIPAKEVGGDFYDIYLKTEKKTGNQLLALTVADASGKGISACLYSLGVRSMLRTYATDYDDVAKIMSLTNSLFCQDTGDTGMFVTVLMGLYCSKTRRLHYFSCGHNPGIVRKADGRIVTLSHAGMAMGLMEFKDVREDIIELSEGDVVIFYTDGVTEAHNEKNQLFSENRLYNCLRRRNWVSANDFAMGIVNEVSNFVGSAPQHDDITILVMKVK